MQSNAPVDTPAPIQTSEYRGRLSRVQAEMASTGLDALFITSEDNFRWLTGFNAPVWQNLTRPRYCIVPAHGDPVLILPSGNDVISNRTAAWIRDVRSWAAPNPDDDGVTLVIDALAGCAGAHRRIGAELGRESRVTMPIGDFLRIRDGIAPAQMVDADWMLRTLRMVKSPAEIAIMRHVCQLVSRAFEALPGLVRIGDTERDVAAAFQCEVLRNGGEKIPYLICTSGAGGYPCSNLGPTLPGDAITYERHRPEHTPLYAFIEERALPAVSRTARSRRSLVAPMHDDDSDMPALGPVTDQLVSIPILLRQRRSVGCFTYPSMRACHLHLCGTPESIRLPLPR